MSRRSRSGRAARSSRSTTSTYSPVSRSCSPVAQHPQAQRGDRRKATLASVLAKGEVQT
jgi:hypothetical protein